MNNILDFLQKNRQTLLCRGVYAFVFIHQGKQLMYIGSSKNMYLRMRQHVQELQRNKHYNRRFQGLWNTLSEVAFTPVILEHCSFEEQFDVEQIFINVNENINLAKKVRSIPRYSNGLKGLNYQQIYGTNNPANGFKSGNENIARRPEVRKILSEKTTKQWKEGRGRSYPKSVETRLKMSEARKHYWEKKNAIHN